MNSQELLAIAVDAIDNKKGEDTISLEMKGISDMTDYFVVTHGNNERQVQAIARAVKEVANEQNIEVKRMEGYNEARWILIDLVMLWYMFSIKTKEIIIILKSYIKMHH
ncbi:Iojap-related protein [Staphylococcus aureus]|uniref:Iojap-related protein n=1 Tax=Staphylococcus aureus TaxID=1280 RepID=A0A380DVR8_STAAU|nr:Iojap-related protein [Staphylococcus aureus]